SFVNSQFLQKKGFTLLVTVAFDIFLIACVILLMRHTQDLLNSDARLSLTEITKQNREVIVNNINLELTNQQLDARSLASHLTDEQADAYEMHIALMALLGTLRNDLFIASVDGIAYVGNGDESVDISGRQYFRLAKLGESNISNKIIDRTTGDEIFITSVPVYYHGKIIGTLQKKYRPEQLYSILVPSFFATKGTSYIINQDGTILLSSHMAKTTGIKKIFDELSIIDEETTKETIQNDLAKGKSGLFRSMNKEGQTFFSSYDQIKNTHNWVLVTSIAQDAIAPHSGELILLFYIILFTLCVIFGVTIFYAVNLKQKEQEELERQVFHDPVTDGLTFNKMIAELPKIVRESPNEPWYMLAFDIDRFRYINSSYGFEFGNAILREVSVAISSRLGPKDVLTRLWGDYFAVLLCRDDPEKDMSLLAPIKSSKDLSLTLTGGLYKITNANENVRDLYDKASLAGNQIKKDIHSTIKLYDEALNQSLIKNETMKLKIQKAIEKRELLPFFQPKIDINSGKLVGAEALARWRTPEGELISPADFIPICESSGLVVEVDMLIYEKVLYFIQEFGDPSKCVPISINFSRRHLENPHFVKNLLAKLDEYNVSAKLVELELTESLFYDNQKDIITLVNKLSNVGLKVSMDDFGTGYSSLSMLKDVHVDVLKIDQSFLRQSDQKNKRDIIFTSIVEMAKRLNIDIVVEGVETEENVKLMRQCRCSVAQGFYFSRPLAPEIFRKVYTQGYV
ncbi:MAG: EAL domain-containing protein, partial [Desulfovibrio sp.]|nr:EAL domain-containing protein [Desulfovibrio sp.]